MKMSRSLVLSIIGFLLINSATAGPVRSCIAFNGVATADCKSQCKILFANPGEEGVGYITNLGTSPPLCFCSYNCGGTISKTCRFPTGSLIKDDPNVIKGCDDLCRGGYLNGTGKVGKYVFGDICECLFDC